MRLIINAVPLSQGGGRTVGINFLRLIQRVRPGLAALALVPSGAGYEEVCEEAGMKYIAVARGAFYPLWRIWFDQVRVPLLARRWRADVLFTMGNVGPIFPGTAHAVLFHNAYYVYDLRDWWERLIPRERVLVVIQRFLFSRAMRRTNVVAAQTQVMTDRLKAMFPSGGHEVRVVPNSISLEHLRASESARTHPALARREADSALRLITIAQYYPHKNLELIVSTARRLRDQGDRRFRFYITIDADQHPLARGVIESIAEEGLQDLVVNLGPLSLDELGGVYRAADGLFFPTLMESFSGTYLEAMYYGLPILTSNLDFARGICGDAAIYFDPDREQSVGDALESFADPAVRAEYGERSRQQMGKYDVDWSTIASAYADMLEELAGSGNGR